MATSEDNPHNEVGRVYSFAKQFERLIGDSGMQKNVNELVHPGIYPGIYQSSTAFSSLDSKAYRRSDSGLPPMERKITRLQNYLLE